MKNSLMNTWEANCRINLCLTKRVERNHLNKKNTDGSKNNVGKHQSHIYKIPFNLRTTPQANKPSTKKFTFFSIAFLNYLQISKVHHPPSKTKHFMYDKLVLFKQTSTNEYIKLEKCNTIFRYKLTVLPCIFFYIHCSTLS